MSIPVLTAMFQCQSVTSSASAPGVATTEHLTLVPVYGKENEPWSKFTPSGQLEMTITNPEAFGKVKPGHVFQITMAVNRETAAIEQRLKPTTVA